MDDSYYTAPSISPYEKSLLNGNVKSMQFSIDLKREKNLFFNRTANPIRRIQTPIIGKLLINGLTSNIREKSLSSIFGSSQNFRFKMQVDIGSGKTSESNSVIIIENINVISSSFQVQVNNFIEYNLECEFEITKENGFKIYNKNTDSITDGYLNTTVLGSDSSEQMRDIDLEIIKVSVV